jgi:2-oxoisovalerate dehydrogenase E1 component
LTGDGGASEGDFHEALNVAAVWDLPVIFVIENNGYGLSTLSSEQFRCKQFADKGNGYGIDAYTIDGNNILEVYTAVKDIKKQIANNPKPVILECMTFRMRGHEEASGTKYVPKALLNQWKELDPINNFEAFLLDEKVITNFDIDRLKNDIKKEINIAWKDAESAPLINSEPEKELADIYKEYLPNVISPSNNKSKKRLVDAISDSLRQSMLKYDNLILMGQDIAEYGGVKRSISKLVITFSSSKNASKLLMGSNSFHWFNNALGTYFVPDASSCPLILKVIHSRITGLGLLAICFFISFTAVYTSKILFPSIV